MNIIEELAKRIESETKEKVKTEPTEPTGETEETPGTETPGTETTGTETEEI